MERHFEHDLEELKERLLWMAGLAERAVHQAVQGVCQKDEALATRVLDEEKAINEMQIEIDDRVMQLVALQQPMAVDLRILRHPQVKPYVDLPRMSELAEGMVRDSLNSLVRRDADLAKSVLVRDDQVDNLRDQIFRELLTYMMENSAVIYPAFELVLVTKNLERIGDHATNIAEDVIYMVAGRDVRHLAADRR